MKYSRPISRLASLALFSAGVFVAGSVGGSAPASAITLITPSSSLQALVSVSQLKGSWAMTLTGDTGCGITTSFVTFTLNASGSGSATQQQHSSVCGDVVSKHPFVITSLNANGSGTANLSCGTDCGWNLTIQVSLDRDEFSVVDVSPVNPNNYLEGIAIRQ